MCDQINPLEAWRRWRTWILVANSGSDATVRTYSGNVLRFLAETDAKAPADYTEDDVVQFLARFARQGHAKYEYLKALRSFFRWGVRNLVMVIDPTEHIRSRKPRRVPPIALTEDELSRVFLTATSTLGERSAWALMLMYTLGLRRVEAAGLKWEHIRQAEAGPVIEIRATKDADQRPPLPLEAPALECLDRLRRLPRPHQATLGPEYIIGARPGTLSSWARRAGLAAGLHPRKIGAHRLRATRATVLLKRGNDVRVVQRVLGHARLESTAWYLAEPDEAEIRAALAGA